MATVGSGIGSLILRVPRSVIISLTVCRIDIVHLSDVLHRQSIPLHPKFEAIFNLEAIEYVPS